MEIRIEIPVDSEGYLRRQCPRCEEIFKWHRGPVGEIPPDAPDPVIYFCPYCGESSGLDQWNTDEQVEHLRTLAANEARKMVEKQLSPSVDRLNRSGGMVKMTLSVPHGNPPPPLVEPDDMVAVAPPCHPYEPVKIADGWVDPIHCLICGSAFVIDID